MDITHLTAGVSLFKEALSLIKEMAGITPSRQNRDGLSRIMEKAEMEFKDGEAKLAVEFGYALCRSHWPPVIMLETEEKNVFACPACGKKEDRRPASVGVSRTRSPRSQRW